MDLRDFETVLDRQIQQSRDTLSSKAREYATDSDRLHNFKVAAGMVQGTPEQAAWGMVVKHLASLSDMVKSEEFYPTGVWDEKIGDSINFFILLRALVFESEMERTEVPKEETGLEPQHASIPDVNLNT